MTGPWREQSLETADGIRVRGARYLPETPPTAWRGGFFVLPGRGEFIEKYQETCADLAARGFASVVIDWRGHGLSESLHSDPQRCHARDFSEYLKDLRAVFDAFGADLPRPHLMFGYSMGAHIGLRWLHDHQTTPMGEGGFAAAVLLAPMIDFPLAPRTRMTVRLLAAAFRATGQNHRYLPGYGPYDPEKRWSDMPVLTSHRPRFARLLELTVARPELTVGGPTYGWLGAALVSSDLIQSNGYPEAIATPCLVLEAELDRVVRRAAIAPYAARLPNARHAAIAGSQHEVLFETDEIRDSFFGSLDEFLEKILPQP